MTPNSLAWFSPFMVFFQGSTNFLMIAFGLLIVRTVSRPGWRHHLRWAVPAVVAPVLTGIGRLPLDRLSRFGNAVQATTVTNVAEVTLYVLAALTSLYATWMLWRTLRTLAQNPAATDPLMTQPAQPGVWPPPPTAGRD